MGPLRTAERPKSHKGRRFLENRESKINENQKRTLFLRNSSTSQKCMQAITDLNHLKKPEAVLYSKSRQDILPFEDPVPIEKMCHKIDASLFTLARHSKKKPNSLVCGRLFDGSVLDMFEFMVEDITPLSKFLGTLPEGKGNKPLLVFAGEEFDKTKTTQRLKNFLVDYFRGNVIDKLSLQGVKYVISFFLVGDVLNIMPYSIRLLKSGVNTPRVELLPSGPQMELKLCRSSLATDDLFRQSLKQPKESKIKKTKNVSIDPFHTKLGRVHMEKQDFSKLQLRKVKVYKTLDHPNAGLPPEVQEKMKEKGYESNDVILDSDDE